MRARNLLAISTISFLATTLMVDSASSQAGSACSGTSCGLGGQIRYHIGGDRPLPISSSGAFGPATSGPFTAITMITSVAAYRFQTALPVVGQGLGVHGKIKPTPSATIMQTTAPGTGPRGLTLAPGAFHYGGHPPGSIATAQNWITRLAVQTDLSYDIPHPGTTKLGAAAVTQESGGPIPTGTMANKLYAGGRVGAATVSFYADATANGTVGTNFGATVAPTPMAGEAGTPPINGVARFLATGSQFGGQIIGRAVGSVKVFSNLTGQLSRSFDLPCKVTATPLSGTTRQLGSVVPFKTGPQCRFTRSIRNLTASDATVLVEGAAFNALATKPAYATPTGVFTGTIGFNGTILGTGAPVTAAGVGIPFTRDARQTVGLPYTTGRLSITVTGVDNFFGSEMFVRTGTDARDAAGNGVVALVSGSMTARDISGGNANRVWMTIEVPEPSAILGAAAGLFALFGCHRLARRRP